MDEGFPKRTHPDLKTVVVGESLSTLSEENLSERIEALEADILRTKEEIKRRSDTRNADEQLFK